MRHKPTGIIRYQPIGFADAHAGGDTAYEPTAYDRVVAVEVGELCVVLYDVAFAAVLATGLFGYLSVLYDLDIGTFAAVDWFCTSVAR